jgi:archaeal type IV pilus assembly protein PilA
MKNHTRMFQESAVSPVIAVMLMLVVTIIIAAVVSAFAGGMTETKNTAPQASISATFSQSKGMHIYHEGGDTLYWIDTKLNVRPQIEAADYQRGKSAISYEILKYNGTKRYVTYPAGMGTLGDNNSDPTKIIVFKPGDVVYIAPEDLWVTQIRPDGTVDYYNNDYGMGSGSSLLMGTHADLDIIDSKSGTIVASTKFLIAP